MTFLEQARQGGAAKRRAIILVPLVIMWGHSYWHILWPHCAVSVHIEVDGTTLGRQVQPMSDKMGPATCVVPSIWVWFASTSSTSRQPDPSAAPLYF